MIKISKKILIILLLILTVLLAISGGVGYIVGKNSNDKQQALRKAIGEWHEISPPKSFDGAPD